MTFYETLYDALLTLSFVFLFGLFYRPGATESIECQRRRLPSPGRLPSRFGLSQLLDGWRGAGIDNGPICQLGLRPV